MKIAPLAILVMALALGTPHSGALTLQAGQSIGIDFGPTPPDNHFNQCDATDPVILTTGSLPVVIDTGGTAVNGIGISFGGSNVLNSQDGTTQDMVHYTGFTLSNIEDAVTGNDLTFTFSGLDPQQVFTLDLVSSFSIRNIGTEFFVGGFSITTDSTSTTGGTLAHFANLIPDANGRITITTLGHDTIFSPSWVGVNAALLTVQAIPEPSTSMLSLIGMAGMLLLVRKRRMPSRRL